jgi:hypothetical protein
MVLIRRLVGSSAALIGLLLMPAAALAAAPAPPSLVGAASNNTTLAGTTSVAVSGHYAYTTSYWAGYLTVLDISNPSNPTVVGSAGPNTNLQNGTDVTVSGNYAFVTSKNRNASLSSNDDGSGNSLTIVDVSNPASPAILGTPLHDTARLFGAYGIAVSGNYAYVAYQGLLTGQPPTPDMSTGGFTVINITNPGGPTFAGNIDNNSLAGHNYLDHATSVAISGHYAYVTAFYDARLTVIDISNPAAPSIVASLRDPTNMPWPNAVAISGNYAYVASQAGALGNQLAIVNIANPAAPAIAGSFSNPLLNNAYNVQVRGGFAYVIAEATSTMEAIDVSNPGSPRLAGYVQDAAHLFAATGIGVDSTGHYVLTASTRLSTESGGNTYPPFPTTNHGTISDIQLDPLPISVSIAPSSEPPNPTNQTSANFSFSLSDEIATVACKLDNAPLGPCTTPTSAQYSALGAGSHRFTVQATDAAGITASSSYTWSVGTSPPSNTALPTISGATRQHAVLTGTLGSWAGSPSPSLSTEWLRCNSQGSSCRTIAGATGTRYTLTASDVGSRIRLSVTARNSSGSASARSAPTAIVKANLAGSFAASAHGGPTLHLTVSVSASSSGVVRIVLALPHGLRFTKRLHRLSAGVHLTDGAGKRLRFTAALRQGTLVLTLKRAATTVRVTVGPRAISASGAVAARSSVKLTVTFTLTGGQRFRGSLRLRVVRAAAALP